MDDQDVIRFAEVLKFSTNKLIKLDIGYNANVTENGVQALINSLKNENNGLQKLSFGVHRLNGKKVRELIEQHNALGIISICDD